MCASDDLRFLWSRFTIWALLPYGVLFLVGYFARSRRVLVTAATVAVLCGLGSLYYLYNMFLARPDAQGALIFLSLPFCQLVLVLLAVGIAALISTIRQRIQTNQPGINGDDHQRRTA
jgi:hypothetical protein